MIPMVTFPEVVEHCAPYYQDVFSADAWASSSAPVWLKANPSNP
jgi:hypothetical protein